MTMLKTHIRGPGERILPTALEAERGRWSKIAETSTWPKISAMVGLGLLVTVRAKTGPEGNGLRGYGCRLCTAAFEISKIKDWDAGEAILLMQLGECHRNCGDFAKGAPLLRSGHPEFSKTVPEDNYR